MLSSIIAYVRRHHVAYVALLVALGGTAFALERDSVRSPQIKDGQVKAADLGVVKVVQFPGPYSIPYSAPQGSITEEFTVKVPEPGLLSVYVRAEIGKNYSSPPICNLGIDLPGNPAQPVLQQAFDTDNAYSPIASAPGSRDGSSYAGTAHRGDGGWLVFETGAGRLEGSITMGRVLDTNCLFRNVELYLMPLT